ncbi:MAG: glycosyltransferase [Endozoicomonadaceae bacterium]|nr:glycosyltransferase [Endozoicomonadaceae bacterium]
MKILQVNTHDKGGGAEQVAYSLYKGIQAAGHDSRLAVGWQHVDDVNIVELNPDQHGNLWKKIFIYLAGLTTSLFHKDLSRYSNKALRLLAEPDKTYRWFKGEEEFDYPLSINLLDFFASPPDLIHFHNLHGNYFDLRYLIEITKKVPVLVTLHDEWLYTGHCAATFDCDRWHNVCGHCPALDTYPKVLIDNTTKNLNLKKQIYSQSKFYVSTPADWLMKRVKKSVLAPAIIDTKVIYNGIDTTVFKPADKTQARQSLGIDQDVYILLAVANFIKSNKFKNYQLALQATIQAGEQLADKKIVLFAIGEGGETEYYDNTEVHFKPYICDPKILANYYQAADIYLHAAKAEVWGLTITEAMACGKPVIATAVGGIPEQVISLHDNPDNATGILVERDDSNAMSEAIRQLLQDEVECNRLGKNAAIRASTYFDKQLMLNHYLDWYKQILEQSR